MQAAKSGKGASLLILIQNVLLAPYAIFFLTNISVKSKNISFFREAFDWCVLKKEWCPVRAFADHHIYNVLSFNTCSTIFTKSRTKHVIVHVQQSRRNLEQHLSLTPERHLPAVVWREGLLQGGEGGLLGALRDSVGKFKRNRCKCVGSDWRRGRVVTFCLYCRAK